MEQHERPMSISGFVLLAVGGVILAGYPMAWVLLSPKSVLRSTDAAFVIGFGAGVGMAVGVTVGLTMLGFAWSRFARRFSTEHRRRIEVGLLVSVVVAVLVVTALRAAH